MFLKIFYAILFISIFNEVSNADPLPGCYSFSDHKNKSSNDDVLVIHMESNMEEDLHFISVGVPEFSPAMLVLSSCEIGSTALGVVNETLFVTLLREYKKGLAKNLTLDFSTYQNSCIPIASIKDQLQKIIFGEPENPTVYIILTPIRLTAKKSIKKISNNVFQLVSNCEKIDEFGQIKDLTEIDTLIKELATLIHEAGKIEFTKTKGLLTVNEIRDKTIEALKNKYKDHPHITQLPTSIISNIPAYDRGAAMKFDDRLKKFVLCQINDCSGPFFNFLWDSASLDEAIDNITRGTINMVENFLKL